MLALPVLLGPLLTVAALAMGASRFYDNTVARLETPGGLIAAVANYGGAQIFDRNGVLLYRFSETDGGLRLPARLDQVSKAMIVVNDQCVCTAANPAALRILGVPARAIIGHTLDSVLPVLRPADDSTRPAGEEYFEIGGRSVALSRSTSGAAGRLSVIALRDITESRSVERMKRDFVATVSHELRTPLTAIQATVSMLHGGDAGTLSEIQQRMVGLLDRNTERLRVLVDDLLDIGALEGGRVTLSRARVDLAQICSAIVEETRAFAQQENVTLSADLGAAEAYVDVDRMRQVVENLLQNAVKFTPAGGSVSVTTRADGDHAYIEVRDTGIGIAPADLDRIFEKFYRTTAGARFASGSGLGLSIAHSIVALHGGSLTAESDGAQGTTMIVKLPSAEPREA